MPALCQNHNVTARYESKQINEQKLLTTKDIRIQEHTNNKQEIKQAKRETNRII